MKDHDSDAYTMIQHDHNIKEFIIKKDVLLEEKDIRESGVMSDNGPSRYFVLFGLSDGSRVSADARRVAASEEYFNHVAALAIYGEKTYETIRANLFSKVHRPKVLTRSFENRQQAMDWLMHLAKRKG